MKKATCTMLAVLALSACSHQRNYKYDSSIASRMIASSQEEDAALLKDSLRSSAQMKLQVNFLSQRVYHSYVQGQELLKAFDQKLDRIVKNKFSSEDILTSDIYADLLATRHIIDESEEKLLNYYLFYSKVFSHPNSSIVEKENSKVLIEEMDKFLSGQIGEMEEVPDSLKGMVLTNIVAKHTNLYNQLDQLSKDEDFTQNDVDSKIALSELKNQILKSKVDFNNILLESQKSKSDFDKNLKDVSKDAKFNQLKQEIHTLGDEIQVYQESMRTPSSEATIFPSTTSSGNITGNGFPANTWSITYDDGPGGATSPTVLKNLQDRGVKATFFQLAQQVVALPKLATSIKDAGMDMASHSYTHAQLTKVGPVQLEKEITTAKKVIEEKLGIKLKLFRLPYGAGVSVPTIREKIAANNMVHVFWNIDTLDWQDKNPDSIVARSLKQIAALKKNAGIVLFHDIHPQSVIASAKLIDAMKTKGTKFCTVQEVVDQINSGAATCGEVKP
jgi:peptidoglycan/xylan/chitin deacetylase (PgdA/CDA1 family)